MALRRPWLLAENYGRRTAAARRTHGGRASSRHMANGSHMFSVSIVSTAAEADVTATVCGRGNSTAAVELPLAIEIYKTTAAVADVTEA